MEKTQGGLEGPDPGHTEPAHTPNGADDANQAGTNPPATSRRNERPGLKLLPLKVRRIKSEKLGRKTSSSTSPVTVSSIEPLTPPPQYDDMPPELPQQ